jgi:parallel beta-helix repeat protein
MRTGSRQTIDTLIGEEAHLFAKFLKHERETWIPRIACYLRKPLCELRLVFNGCGKGKLRKIVSVILAFLLIGTFILASNIGLVRAQAETIYINSDGSVSPSSAPISTIDKVTYTFTGDVSYPTYYGVVVKRSNILIDGNGYTVQGNNSGFVYDQSTGLKLTNTDNVTIKNINVKGFCFGIYLSDSSNNVVNGNNATANWGGLFLVSSSNNVVSDNNAGENVVGGISLEYSNNNTVSGNALNSNISTAAWPSGIALSSSSNNTVSGNVIEGNFSTLGTSAGICLGNSSVNIVSRNTVTGQLYGIWLDYLSSFNTVSGNNATANEDDGILLDAGSDNNVIIENTAMATEHSGIELFGASYNIVSGNNVTRNENGIVVQSCSYNAVYHNNIIANYNQATMLGLGVVGNVWDDGYPSGGNYWSDYNGTDLYSGQYQNVTGSDGIGDTPYVIDSTNVDHYPLMGTFQTFSVPNSPSSEVDIISNFTVGFLGQIWADDVNSPTGMDLWLFLSDVVGPNGTVGFFRITFPTYLDSYSTYHVGVLNGDDDGPFGFLTPCRVLSSNDTSTTLYFTFSLSSSNVNSGLVIIPEFPSFLILPLFIIATLAAVAFYKKKAMLYKRL